MDITMNLMLENISFIASVICALSAVTTSFRAVGVSREYSNHDTGQDMSAASRIGEYRHDVPPSQRSSLKLHFIVTLIWFSLSVIFIVPVVMQKWAGGSLIWLTVIGLSYIFLILLLIALWKKVRQT